MHFSFDPRTDSFRLFTNNSDYQPHDDSEESDEMQHVDNWSGYDVLLSVHQSAECERNLGDSAVNQPSDSGIVHVVVNAVTESTSMQHPRYPERVWKD